MEKINCLFCKKNSNNVVIEENNFKGRECKKCDLIYISPRPSIEEIFDIYGHDNAHISAKSHIGGDYLKKKYAQHTLNIIKKYKSSGSLLEIGSGGGHFLYEAKNYGFEPYGIELNPKQANYIKNFLCIPCEEKPLSSESFGEKKFDIIYHSDVISHFHDPVAEFKTMHQKLKSGGLMVFETGNIADIDKKYYKDFTRFQYPDHLFFFGEKSIKNLLEKTGFKLFKIKRYAIGHQLQVLKWVNPINNSQPKHAATSVTKNSSGLKTYFKKTYHMGMYFLRYKLGAIMPKKNKPQTIIVVAEKVL